MTDEQKASLRRATRAAETLWFSRNGDGLDSYDLTVEVMTAELALVFAELQSLKPLTVRAPATLEDDLPF